MSGSPSSTRLWGRRVLLRPLEVGDFAAWQEVRRRNVAWLTPWEPRRVTTAPDAVESREAFSARCAARVREWQMGVGFGFGVFAADEAFAGEMNVSSVQRGPFQSAEIGYWIDEAQAGHGYTPEALVTAARFCFEDLGLHRIQVAIVPRNEPSRRVAEKVGLREEGVALRYLEINGVWEDHVRYAMTSEEWDGRRDELLVGWVL